MLTSDRRGTGNDALDIALLGVRADVLLLGVSRDAEIGSRAGLLGCPPFSELRLKTLAEIVAELEYPTVTLSADKGWYSSWFGLPGVNPPVVSSEDRDS